MLEIGCLQSAIMYKFVVSSRFVTKLKNEGAAMLEQAEQKTAILCNQSPCVEANTRKLKRSCTDSSNLRDLAIEERSLLIHAEILLCNDLTNAQRAQLEN